MILHNHDFSFSTLNAADVDRMRAAQEKQVARARAESDRYTPEGSGYTDWLRFQCRIFMDYLDEVLGEGASALLGLDGEDFSKCIAVSEEFAAAMEAEKNAVLSKLKPAGASPVNRAQRRQKKHKPRSRSEGFAPALKMVERVDEKAARRAELLRELKELENG